MNIGYNLIRYTYGAALIVVGLDKFLSMNYLTNWAQYLNTSLVQALSLQLSTVLMMVGIAEIAVGILVIIKPRIGGAIAVAWLGLIIFNLVSMGMFYDIAARDVLIAVGFAQLILR
jgi:hypothetical protein